MADAERHVDPLEPHGAWLETPSMAGSGREGCARPTGCGQSVGRRAFVSPVPVDVDQRRSAVLILGALLHGCGPAPVPESTATPAAIAAESDIGGQSAVDDAAPAATLPAAEPLRVDAPPAPPVARTTDDVHRCFGMTPDGRGALVTTADYAGGDGTTIGVDYALAPDVDEENLPQFFARFGEQYDSSATAVASLDAGLDSIEAHVRRAGLVRCRSAERSDSTFVAHPGGRTLTLETSADGLRRSGHAAVLLVELHRLDAYDFQEVVAVFYADSSPFLFVVVRDVADADMGGIWSTSVRVVDPG